MKNIRSSLFLGFALALFQTLVFAAPQVEMVTSEGKIVIELNADKAPKSVENFLRYARENFYAGTVFHRVIPGFMIQGGGFDAKLDQKQTKAPVQNEAANGLQNQRGTIAMARTNDPHSATAQFFINHKNNAGLDYPGQDGWGYTVFGKVTQGMDVVDKIAQAPTGNIRGMQNVPFKNIVIQSVTIISEK
jgi:cyclophilin family peptidyl-prolyl cis-trans isomerase